MDKWDCLPLLLSEIDGFRALRPYAMPIVQRTLNADKITAGGHCQTRGGEDVTEDAVNEDKCGERVEYVGNLRRGGLPER